MTTIPASCRITVLGPSGRADLAVPVSTNVSALLPTLVRHVVRDQDRDGDGHESWALQRLGDAPFDPEGTPETLDWLDGEQLYLTRAENPLPELDFDDVAEGMAAAVNRQGNRWNGEVNRALFLGLTGVAFAAIGVSLFANTSAAFAATTAGVLATLLCLAAVLVARTIADRGLAAVLGVAGCLFACLAGLIGQAGLPGALSLPPWAVFTGGLAMGLAAAVLLLIQRLFARDLPIVSFGCAAVAGLGALLAMFLHLNMDFTALQTAPLVMVFFFVLLLFAPKLATRAARLRGPQLPRNAEEMKIDIESVPAARVIEQTGHADRYLGVLTIGSSAVFGCGFWYLLRDPHWLDFTLALLLAAAILLRSREFLDIAQRTALVLAGTWGLVLLSLGLLAGMNDVERVVGTAALVLGAFLLVAAALRPAHRRVLPIWPHLSDVLENACCLALVPFLLQALGVFAWARGLAG
ncbi:type VII secretion integral membrane protein EccD [Umezawaea tangerina]|uniref:Type VII secretion integral membrane protein EccD n=1 Tax=Umezawaea tangerina TaxID=84725 RepID=A0A2T0T003_9PSEU|nr:type VII secretion integral membrane protein EccD [Umezawaea tangerina]PRY38974.1 type VII secretion integral membrane protein EccD [Umezawaea tangerina]